MRNNRSVKRKTFRLPPWPVQLATGGASLDLCAAVTIAPHRRQLSVLQTRVGARAPEQSLNAPVSASHRWDFSVMVTAQLFLAPTARPGAAGRRAAPFASQPLAVLRAARHQQLAPQVGPPPGNPG